MPNILYQFVYYFLNNRHKKTGQEFVRFINEVMK
jgi:hypothetical protein